MKLTPEQHKQRFLNDWKRQNRRKTMEGNRLKLAYNVPGTQEAGKLAMWLAQNPSCFVPFGD